MSVYVTQILEDGRYDEACGLAYPMDPALPGELAWGIPKRKKLFLVRKKIQNYLWLLVPVNTRSVKTIALSFILFSLAHFNVTTYWILDTDYDNYSVIYHCNEAISGNHSVLNGWILTRETNPPLSLVSSKQQQLANLRHNQML